MFRQIHVVISSIYSFCIFHSAERSRIFPRFCSYFSRNIFIFFTNTFLNLDTVQRFFGNGFFYVRFNGVIYGITRSAKLVDDEGKKKLIFFSTDHWGRGTRVGTTAGNLCSYKPLRGERRETKMFFFLLNLFTRKYKKKQKKKRQRGRLSEFTWI